MMALKRNMITLMKICTKMKMEIKPGMRKMRRMIKMNIVALMIIMAINDGF